MPIKLNIFFRHPRGGWSETYFSNSSDLTTFSNAVINGGFLDARAAILASPALITALRFSVEDVFRQTRLFEPPTLSGFDATYPSDTPWQSQMILLQDAAFQYRRHIFIRGIPDIIYGPPPDLVTAGAVASWQLKLNQFLALLVGGTLCIKVVDATRIRQAIASFQLVGGQLQVNMQPGGAAFVEGRMVQYYNATPVTKGRDRIASINGDSLIMVSRGLTYPTLIPRSSNPKLRQIGYTYAVIQNTTVEEITHRIVGRPFGEQRGRRAARSRTPG